MIWKALPLLRALLVSWRELDWELITVAMRCVSMRSASSSSRTQTPGGEEVRGSDRGGARRNEDRRGNYIISTAFIDCRCGAAHAAVGPIKYTRPARRSFVVWSCVQDMLLIVTIGWFVTTWWCYLLELSDWWVRQDRCRSTGTYLSGLRSWAYYQVIPTPAIGDPTPKKSHTKLWKTSRRCLQTSGPLKILNPPSPTPTSGPPSLESIGWLNALFETQ